MKKTCNLDILIGLVGVVLIVAIVAIVVEEKFLCDSIWFQDRKKLLIKSLASL